MPVLFDLPDPTSGIILAQENVTAKTRTESYGPGRLFVTEECVSWISREHKGFVLSYIEISLHAVSKDPASFPEECIYLLLDCDKSEESDSDDNMETNGNGPNGDAEHETREIYFVPEDKSSLEAIFSAMAAGQALHPDPADIDSDDDLEDTEEFEEGLDAGVGPTSGAGDLSLDGPIHDDQFEDEEHDDSTEHHRGAGDS